MTKIDSAPPRHWFIQKPIAHNCPLRSVGAVFQTYMPTVSEQNCEWVKVVDAEAYDALAKENDRLREAYTLMRDAACLSLDCECSAKDRLSGHKTTCQVPHIEFKINSADEALEKTNE